MDTRLRPMCAWGDTGSEHDGRRRGSGSAAAEEGNGSAHGGNAAYAPQDEPTAGAISKASESESENVDPNTGVVG